MALVPAQSNVALVRALSSGNRGKEKRVRAENWTWEETVRLVEAKKREWEEKENGSLLKFTTTTDKWAKVQEYMKESSLFRARSVEQIRQKWEALYNSWKKIKVSNNEGGDYWMMAKEQKIDKRLPTSFDRRLWDMLNSFLGQKNVSRNDNCFDSMCDGTTPSGLLNDVSKPYLDPLGEDLNEANRALLSDDNVSINPAEKSFFPAESGRRPFGEGDLLRDSTSGKRRKSRGPDAFLELVRESNKSIVEALSVQREDKQEELKLVLALEERKLQIEGRKLDMEIRDRESVGRDREKMANALCSIIEAIAIDLDPAMQNFDCCPKPPTEYDGSQVQKLLHLTESLMEEGRVLKCEIDAMPLDDQGAAQPMSQTHKKRFMHILTQVVFVLQQALLVFPEILGGQTIPLQRASLTWHLLQDDNLDIDSLIIQCFLVNKQNCISCAKFIQMEEETWVRPKSRFYFYKFFLELYDNGRWQEIMKMSQKSFFWLCNKMAPHVRKSDTNYRQAIPVPCRLAACIYKLVTGCRSAEIMRKFGIGRSTLYSILRQVIPGIIEVLGGSIRWPKGQAFRATSFGIQEICSLPNCGGIVGGCDIPIVAPIEDPWAYMNVNQEYSVVLQVTCNHERKFTSVNVGKAGSMDYSGVLQSSSLFQKANSGALFHEDLLTLPCGSEISPYLIGDYGYPSLEWLLTPYTQTSNGRIGPMHALYNEKLVQAKGLVDQSFAILKGTFLELASPCLLDIELVPQIIGACCVLHNILIDRKDVKPDDFKVWDVHQASVRVAESVPCDAEMNLLDEHQEALIKRDTIAYYLMNFPHEENLRVASSTDPLPVE